MEPLFSYITDPGVLISLVLVAAGVAFYLATRRRAETISIPLDNQSFELSGGVRISRYCKDEQLVTHQFEDVRTLYEGFQRGKRVSSDGNCLGWRETATSQYSWLRYSEVEKRFMNFGCGMSHIGIPAGQKSFIGICASNCVEWSLTDLSCQAFSRVIVALYDSLGKEAMTHIINQADIECVICTPFKVKTLIALASSCPTLKVIISIGSSVTDEDRQAATEAKLKIYTFKEVEELGEANPSQPILPSPDDISTICYTSGTTGLPKGVILTHGNIVANVAGLSKQLEESIVFGPDDVYMSYLPLAHMLERCAQACMFTFGSKVGIYRGDIKTLVNDIQTLRPTIFVSVPRLLNRVYDRVLTGLSDSKVKKLIFDFAFKAKLKDVQNGILRRDSIWDTIVFGKIQRLLGGKVRLIMSGSAPISERVLKFYQVAFGCYVTEGYGQTEVTAACTNTLPADTKCGNVGPPTPNACVKLVDVPELNYYASNGEGEVCVKGPCCTQGYYKEPEKTRALIDEDGWVHSGDIGKWLPNGTLKITDRVKHIFKLAQGEYIAPEKVENVCSHSLFIAQLYIYGDSLRSCCVAIVVPEEDLLMKWAKNNGREKMTFEDLCSDEGAKKMIFDDLQAVARRDGLNSMEIPKAIKLYPEQFSVENDLLTPTFKVKRPVAKVKFMSDFVEMYSKLPA